MNWVRKIHKWASLVVGIQFLLWLGSGFYFNLMDHSKVGGRQYQASVQPENGFGLNEVLDPSVVLQQSPPATRIELKNLLGQPVYLLNHQRGLYPHFANQFSIRDAVSGNTVIIDENIARALAEQSYNGPGQVISVNRFDNAIPDFPKQQNPAYQVNFNDEVNTSVYIEAESGRIIGHSDDDKRFADIFFMLHFMDYADEGSFNNIQIILFAVVALWLAFSGMIWVVDLAFAGQLQLPWRKKPNWINLFDKNQQNLGRFTLPDHINLLDALAQQNIALPSSCGGGGVCGHCRVVLDSQTNVTSADKAHISEADLEQGHRLACQHFSHDAGQMTLLRFKMTEGD